MDEPQLFPSRSLVWWFNDPSRDPWVIETHHTREHKGMSLGFIQVEILGSLKHGHSSVSFGGWFRFIQIENPWVIETGLQTEFEAEPGGFIQVEDPWVIETSESAIALANSSRVHPSRDPWVIGTLGSDFVQSTSGSVHPSRSILGSLELTEQVLGGSVFVRFIQVEDPWVIGTPFEPVLWPQLAAVHPSRDPWVIGTRPRVDVLRRG